MKIVSNQKFPVRRASCSSTLHTFLNPKMGASSRVAVAVASRVAEPGSIESDLNPKKKPDTNPAVKEKPEPNPQKAPRSGSNHRKPPGSGSAYPWLQVGLKGP